MQKHSLASRKAQRQFRYYRGQKADLVRYLGGQCQDCGYDRSLAALQVHHTDPAKKRRTFNARTWSQKHVDADFYAELDTCVLLCANCHAERHERISCERIFGSTEPLVGWEEGDSGVRREEAVL